MFCTPHCVLPPHKADIVNSTHLWNLASIFFPAALSFQKQEGLITAGQI